MFVVVTMKSRTVTIRPLVALRKCLGARNFAVLCCPRKTRGRQVLLSRIYLKYIQIRKYKEARGGQGCRAVNYFIKVQKQPRREACGCPRYKVAKPFSPGRAGYDKVKNNKIKSDYILSIIYLLTVSISFTWRTLWIRNPRPDNGD